jgi:hypothetical protein
VEQRLNAWRWRKRPCDGHLAILQDLDGSEMGHHRLWNIVKPLWNAALRKKIRQDP